MMEVEMEMEMEMVDLLREEVRLWVHCTLY
jgi:hypothetical protein